MAIKKWDFKMEESSLANKSGIVRKCSCENVPFFLRLAFLAKTFVDNYVSDLL